MTCRLQSHQPLPLINYLYCQEREDITSTRTTAGGGGDGISILAPTQELVDEANKSGDYNDCSYVLLYRADGRRTVFGGDSHNDTWNHILNTYESEVSNVDLLIAPHHGRDSGRSYEFLGRSSTQINILWERSF